ncbi:hypothetical protein, partial [Spirosoma fluminis]
MLTFTTNRLIKFQWLTVALLFSSLVSLAQPGVSNPGLTLNKLVNKSKASVGGILTYTIVLTNTGSTSASTTVRDSLGQGVSYIPGSAVSPQNTNFTVGSPINLWNVTSLSGGQSLSLTYQVKVDSVGVLYNKATIPGDTAVACTSVPVTVCTGDQYTFRLTGPAGRSKYQWFRTVDGVTTEITTSTTNTLDITQPGEYKLSIDNEDGKCPDFSCCPFIIEENPLPSFTVTTVSTSCVSGSSLIGGQIVLANFTSTYTYQYSEGSDFNASASLSGSPKPVPATGIIASNLPNPTAAKQYTVRVYNPSGCYLDRTVTLAPANCQQIPALALAITPTECLSAINQYSVSGSLSLTNAIASSLTITDGTVSQVVSVSAGQSSANFSLSGLTSGISTHTVTVSGQGYTPASLIYTAPASCSVTPAPVLTMAITPSECLSATNQYSVSGTVSLTNAVASSL